jgi:hypothetical protein
MTFNTAELSTWEPAEFTTLKLQNPPHRDGDVHPFDTAEFTISLPWTSPVCNIHHLETAEFATSKLQNTRFKIAECTTSETQTSPTRNSRKHHCTKHHFRIRHFETANITTLTLLIPPFQNRKICHFFAACLASIGISLGSLANQTLSKG